jgi:hypothetical protein
MRGVVGSDMNELSVVSYELGVRGAFYLKGWEKGKAEL